MVNLDAEGVESQIANDLTKAVPNGLKVGIDTAFGVKQGHVRLEGTSAESATLVRAGLPAAENRRSLVLQ